MLFLFFGVVAVSFPVSVGVPVVLSLVDPQSDLLLACVSVELVLATLLAGQLIYANADKILLLEFKEESVTDSVTD